MEREVTTSELSLLMDLVLAMIKNNHTEELIRILEKYQRTDLLDKVSK